MIKILFIGDIFGRGGREVVKKVLPGLIAEHSPTLVIANAENLSHGKGFTPQHIEEMKEAGVDFFTTGNHFMGKPAGVARLNDLDFPLIRPANVKGDVPGRGFEIVTDKNGKRILVINLMGEIFMKGMLDSPFKIVDKILSENKDRDAVFIDFHAETTSEKIAFGFYMDGKVSVVVGTHTHVPTADARVLPLGTAYITDVGFTGPQNSVIGVKKELIIHGMLNKVNVRHEPEEAGPMIFNALLTTLDDENQKALNVTHIQVLI